MILPRVSDILGIINKIAQPALAEEWDNVGLMVGDPAAQVKRIMVALDGVRETVDAAISEGCQLLLTHHPFIFRPLRKVSTGDPTGRLVAQAIKHDLAVISLHTNYDIADGGLNDLLAERLGVHNCKPLKVTGTGELVKLGVFVPKGHEEQVLAALFRFSGFIGNYSDCSFRCHGVGTFRPLEGANPFIGEVGKRESVEEARIEVLLRKTDLSAAVIALRKAHPYEEPAFDLYPLLNSGQPWGLGRIGELGAATTLEGFAGEVKKRLGLSGVRFVGAGKRKVKRVALCGGSGASLISDAHRLGADLFVTGDVKYHDARDAEALGLALVDAGHFGTEILMVQGVAARVTRELECRGYDASVVEFKGEKEPFTIL